MPYKCKSKTMKRKSATKKKSGKRRKAKFELKDLLGIGLTLVVFGIGISYGLNVQEDLKDDIGTDECTGYWNGISNVCQVNTTNTTALSTNGAAVNASIDGITGVAKLPEKLPLIATVVVAAIVIGILVRYLFVRFA